MFGLHDLSQLSRRTREWIWRHLRGPILWNRKGTDVGDGLQIEDRKRLVGRR